MKAYKGFNKDMTCRGFRFKEGETYHEDEAKLCSSGFHACEDPIDCFDYYAPSESVYHEVELDEVSDERRDDTKVVAKTIKVGAEIGIPGIVAAHIEYIKNLCASTDAPKEKHSVKDRGAASATGDQGAASATGTQGAASATGDRGAASATGDQGAASATGDQGAASATGTQGAASATGDQGAASATGTQGAASATGYRGAASATGYRGAASATGDRGAASATGYRGAASATGYQGAASATGYQGAASATGHASVATAAGRFGKVRGALGCAIFAVERGEFDGDTYPIIAAVAAIVDGDKIKADTWYTVVNGEFVEADA